MLPIEFEYLLGDDSTSYDVLLSGLPQGDSNLKRGQVVPSHTRNTPQTFRLKNLIPETAYIIDIHGEYATAPTPRMYFSSTAETQLITVHLPYGPATITVKSAYQERSFFVSVTHYGTLFRTYAKEITEYSRQPLSILDASITEDFSYRLALPLLAGMSQLIPSDLEFLGVLAHKLLIKNLLHRPGTNGAAREVLAAFCASNPVLHKMRNISRLDGPMYRSEETFSGHEAHVWLPNREVERWKAFTLLLANLPQFYALTALTEGEVFFEHGGKLRRHSFDFDSPFANTIFESAGTFDCFLRLFRLSATVESEHFLEFCQASYPFDGGIVAPGLSSPDADPMQITNWTGFSLTGRMEQQYGESDKVHHWIYESPLPGEIDGKNRFYRLKGVPKSSRSVKVWIDGILQYFNLDFRISVGSGNRSGAVGFKAGSAGAEAFGGGGESASLMLVGPPTETTPQYLLIETGEPRDFIGPAFTTLEVKGDADLQFLLTVGQQTATNIGVILAEPPYGSSDGTTDLLQEIAVNYVAPALPAEDYPGLNQYGIINLPLGITSYYLEFPRPAAAADYQLFVQLAVDPMPEEGVSAAWQMNTIVRTHTTDGAMIEFSDEITQENTKLYWWIVESDELAMERGTIDLAQGINHHRLNFAYGPYTDKVALLYQLWHTSLEVPVANLLVSHRKINPGGTYIQFSDALPDQGYRLDWCLFAAEAGSFLEFTQAPPVGSLIEVQYDEVWPFWGQGALSPPPDGIRTEFALPFPVAHEKSVYLAINGLLATQGNNRQYTVSNNMVRFASPPKPEQKLWAVYPLKNPVTLELPSAWDQGFAFSRSAQRGRFATATLRKAADRLPVGTTLQIANSHFLGVAPASGQIIVTGRINTNSTLAFEELGVTLKAVPDPVDSFIFDASVVSPTTDRMTIPNHGLESGRKVFLDIGSGLSNLPVGFNSGVTYYVVDPTPDTFKLSPILNGPPVNILTTGVGSFQLTSPNENFFKVNISLADDGMALANCINNHSILSRSYHAEHIENGRILVQAKTLGGFALTKTTGMGTSATIVFVEHTRGFPAEGSFVHQGRVYLYTSKSESTLAGILPRITYSQGDAITLSSLNQTVTFTGSGIDSTHITGDTSPSSFRSLSAMSGLHVITINPLLVDGNIITFTGDHQNFYETMPVKVMPFQGEEIPSGLAENLTYYIRNLQDSLSTGGKEFQLYSASTGGSLVSIGSVSAYFNLVVFEVDASTSRIFSLRHGLYDLQRVKVNGTNLPEVFDVSKIYFVRNTTNTSFQLAEDVTGPVLTIPSHPETYLHVYSIGSFPTDVASDFDFARLGSVVAEDPALATDYNINVYETFLTISAKKIGPTYNALVSASNALEVESIQGGAEPAQDPSFAAQEALYTNEGTVLTLDGLSTRLYKLYSGNEFQFDYRPTLRQEPYYYGEAFPLDYHPLDSMIANEPCNYPKGVFTQGLFSQLTEHDFLHDYNEADRYFRLVVTTTTLPYQEEPQGVCDGVNRVFELTLAAVAGKNSVMLFIDGIFQPTTTFDYQVTSGGGSRLTLDAAPTSEQKLWAWYVPIDTLRFEPSEVDILSSTINLADHALYSGQLISLWASSGTLPDGLQAEQAYYVVNPTRNRFQISLTPNGSPIVLNSQGFGVFRINPSDNLLYERVEALDGVVDGVNQQFSLPHGPADDRLSLHLFLEGLFQLQGQDYLVDVGNDSITYLGDLAPAPGQSVWAHYNERTLDRWRQSDLGVTDGVTDIFTIPFILNSELPTSDDSILLFLNGLCQRRGVDFEVLHDDLGYPTGDVRFLGGAPEANRKVQAAYIKRG